MIQYRCPSCGELYGRYEYRELDQELLDPKHPNHGYESICDECGAGFHTDRWNLIEEVETEDGDITVSTVALTQAHGLNHDQWFETCIFHPHGSNVVARYEEKEDAEAGHEDIVEKVENGGFSFTKTTTGIELDNDA